jgi:bifunctional UDP-N-acetylglucosamine pyrophosphorylase/glucosamine-1-phosphate N-acetyltransferase
MERLLIIPAAGLGSRLGAHTPKLLAPVNGRPMLDHLLAMYAAVDRVALVVHPGARAAVHQALAKSSAVVTLCVQDTPTGMLDAILLARSAVEAGRPRRVWITWCDQVAIHPITIERLVDADESDPLVALPTCVRDSPYVHFARDPSGRIVRVLHRREGDAVPAAGESDAGLFSLSLHAYLELLPDFAAAPGAGSHTGERNFLPFIPWAAQRGSVVTFPCVEAAESIGVNTPEDLAAVERTLRTRATTQR